MNSYTLPHIDGDLYDYRASMYYDLDDFIEDYGGIRELVNDYRDTDSIQEYLYDECFIADSVTGNASGSYWMSTYRAQCALIGNLDLLGDAIDEFGIEGDKLRELMLSPESADVTIRCYLIGEIVATWLEDHADEIDEIRADIESVENELEIHNEISAALEVAAAENNNSMEA